MKANKTQIITGILWTAVGGLVDSKLKEHIVVLIKAQLDSDAEGEEKKAAVMKALRAVGGDLGKAVGKVAGYILSMAVDIAVGYVKSRIEARK